MHVFILKTGQSIREYMKTNSRKAKDEWSQAIGCDAARNDSSVGSISELCNGNMDLLQNRVGDERAGKGKYVARKGSDCNSKSRGGVSASKEKGKLQRLKECYGRSKVKRGVSAPKHARKLQRLRESLAQSKCIRKVLVSRSSLEAKVICGGNAARSNEGQEFQANERVLVFDEEENFVSAGVSVSVGDKRKSAAEDSAGSSDQAKKRKLCVKKRKLAVDLGEVSAEQSGKITLCVGERSSILEEKCNSVDTKHVSSGQQNKKPRLADTERNTARMKVKGKHPTSGAEQKKKLMLCAEAKSNKLGVDSTRKQLTRKLPFKNEGGDKDDAQNRHVDIGGHQAKDVRQAPEHPVGGKSEKEQQPAVKRRPGRPRKNVPVCGAALTDVAKVPDTVVDSDEDVPLFGMKKQGGNVCSGCDGEGDGLEEAPLFLKGKMPQGRTIASLKEQDSGDVSHVDSELLHVQNKGAAVIGSSLAVDDSRSEQNIPLISCTWQSDKQLNEKGAVRVGMKKQQNRRDSHKAEVVSLLSEQKLKVKRSKEDDSVSAPAKNKLIVERCSIDDPAPTPARKKTKENSNKKGEHPPLLANSHHKVRKDVISHVLLQTNKKKKTDKIQHKK